MKKLLITLAAFCLSVSLFAQTANDFPYGVKDTNPESDEDWIPGVSIFYWKLLMETELSAYPKKLTKASSFRGVGIESSMEIEYEGMKFSLGFQKGFLDYLLDEYTLGDKIYLYIDVDSVDAFSKTFNCYVRDFSLISPTEIIQQRIDIVKERVK